MTQASDAPPPAEPVGIGITYREVVPGNLAANFEAMIPEMRRVVETFKRAGEVSQASLRFEVGPVSAALAPRPATAAAPAEATEEPLSAGELAVLHKRLCYPSATPGEIALYEKVCSVSALFDAALRDVPPTPTWPRIVGLLEAIRDNDPDDEAADSVTCGMVWQQEAGDILAALRHDA